MPLKSEDGRALIRLVRESIKAVFSGKDVEVSDEIKGKYSEKLGVFVTLTIDGELRGCIGFPEPVFELYKSVVDAAKSAAFSDPRFGPLSEEEYGKIEVEISVLTKPELINVEKPEDYLRKIRIGEDGLIIRGLYGSGLLLPQVFTEYKCDAEQAFNMVCEKAGLDRDAWKDLNNKIYKFQAQIFKE